MAFCFHHSNGLKSALVSAARRESATSVCPESMTLCSLPVLPQVRPFPLQCPQTPHLHRSQKKLSQRYLLEHYPFGPFHNFHTTAGSHFGPCLDNFRRLFRKCADAHAAPLFRILCPHIRRSPRYETTEDWVWGSLNLVPSPPLPLTKWPRTGWSGIF